MTSTAELLDSHLQERFRDRATDPELARPSSGVLNAADAGYRRAHIDAYAEASSPSGLSAAALADIERHMDMWQVMEIAEGRWVPYPLWDAMHGYLVRPSFASRREALSDIERVGGVRQGA